MHHVYLCLGLTRHYIPRNDVLCVLMNRARPDVRIYSNQPAMNRFTIGRKGELVVRVTIARVSPSGMSFVSRCTLKVTVSPGAATGIELCE